MSRFQDFKERAAVPGKVQQLPGIKEEVPPEQQEWISCVKQEVTEPLSIKEEPAELWSSQEREQLQGPEEADDFKFPFIPDLVNPVPGKVQQLPGIKEEVPPEQQEWISCVKQEVTEPLSIKEEPAELWSSQEREQLQGPEEADDFKFPFIPDLVNPVPGKVQQLPGIKEEVPPEQQEWISCVKQEVTEPLSIKEEPAELWSSQEREQLQGPEEADDFKFPFIPDLVNPVPGKVQQLPGIKEEVPPEQQEWISCVKQEVTEPLSIKEEPAELWSSQEREQLQGPEEADDFKFPFIPDLVNTVPGKVQQLPGIKEEVPPEQQEWISCVKQEVTEPLSIKEEPAELWSSQEREQLQGPEEADDFKFPFIPDPVKSEDDEEKPQSSQLHQQETEQIESGAEKGDCEGLESDKYFDEEKDPKPQTEDKTSEDFSRAETDDSADLFQTSNRKSCLKSADKLKHKGGKPFSCDVCGKGFSQKSQLTNHMRVHTGEKPFGCSECGKTFRHRSSFSQHVKTHSSERPFSCDVCGKGYITKSSLIIHTRVHTGEKPFGCSECGKTFRLRSGLSQHVKSHSRPFSCDACGKGYITKSNLIVHTRVHTGEKPFACSECGKTFHNKYHLTKHVKIHSKERHFSCDVCGKEFIHKSRLIIHKRVHTGEKPFACSECGKTFIDKWHLNTHMKTHSEEGSFYSKEGSFYSKESSFDFTWCFKNLKQMDALRQHMEHHCMWFRSTSGSPDSFLLPA